LPPCDDGLSHSFHSLIPRYLVRFVARNGHPSSKSACLQGRAVECKYLHAHSYIVVHHLARIAPDIKTQAFRTDGFLHLFCICPVRCDVDLLFRCHTGYIQDLCCSRWLDSTVRNHDGGRCVYVTVDHFRLDVLLHTLVFGEDVAVDTVPEVAGRPGRNIQKDMAGPCVILFDCEYSYRKFHTRILSLTAS
jgi:hypothetical protein